MSFPKQPRKFVPLVGLVVLLLVGAWHLSSTSQQKPNLSNEEFSIIIEHTEEGFMAKCEKGCAWKQLSWTCSELNSSCNARVDEHGVSGTRGAGE